MLRWALDRLKRRFISGRFSTNGRTALQGPVDWAPIRDLHHWSVVAVKFIFAAALLRIAEASAKERLRFIGDWSGSPATCKEPFRFTPSRYIAPSEFALTYESIERSDNRFSLKFPDGSGINLAVVKPQRMTWHSPRSGDTFDLRRCGSGNAG